MATQARAVLKIPARIVGAGNISVTLQNGIYVISSTQSHGMEVNNQAGSTYTIVPSDNGKLITFDNSEMVTVTVPSGLGLGFACEVAQLGTGTVTFVENGTTINALGGVTSLTGQYSLGWLRAYAPNAFILSPSGEVFPSETIEATTAFSAHGSMTTTLPVSETMTTSAGVFDSTGLLVRTLWTAEVGNPYRNDPEEAWDGTLDNGSVAPTGSYTIKVISHDIQYTWDGAVGNSSPIHTTATYHAYGSVVRDMAITDAGEIYFTTVYDERIQTVRVTTTSDIQNSSTAFPPQNFRSALIAPHPICTDGTVAYVGVNEGGTRSFVVGSTCGTHTKFQFTSGTTLYPPDWSAICIRNYTSYAGQIVGVAVQKTGSYLFVTRPDMGFVDVHNKTTGAFVLASTVLAHPRRLASNPTTITQLWIANDADNNGRSEQVVKCTVDGAGVITSTATVISCQDALALAISPDGSTLLIAEGGTSQQIKAYNTSDGSARSGWGTSGVLGTAGGYVNSPAVTNTKFMFYAVVDMGSQGPQAFLAYQADGKFWVGDVGNCRYLRFSSGEAPAYIDQFAYIPGFYACRVCRGDATRVFANFLEFEINYSLSLSPTNGSWTLKRNWAGNLIDYPGSTPLNTALYNAMKYVGVYSNGRTYAQIDLPTIAMRRFFELTSTGLRDTTWAVIPNLYIDQDMNGIFVSGAGEGSATTVTRNAFMGFDGSNNPSWAVHDATPGNTTALFGTETLYTSETLPAGFVRTHAFDNNFTIPCDTLANGVIPFSDPNSADGYGSSHNHFGTIHAATGKVMSNTGPLTPVNTGGFGVSFLLYPPAPYFPYNQGLGGGGMLYLPGHEHVFIPFNGEEWGNNQTNMITHWHESGLALKLFGKVGPYFGAMSLRRPDLLEGDNIPADDPYSFLGMPGLAGNCRWGGIAYVDNKYYLYQNDEWYHGGITRWQVGNLESVSVEAFPVSWNSASYVPFTDPTDMLEGLTPDAVLVEGDSGWHRSHAESGADLHIFSGAINADPRKPDIAIQAKSFADDVMRSVSRDLVRSGSGNWTLEGDIYISPGMAHDPNPFVGGLILFDVLDNTGKVIIRWYAYTTGESNEAGTIKVNGADLFPVPAGWTDRFYTRVYTEAVRSFSIVANVSAGTMTFNYDTHSMSVPAVFEVGAVIGSPSKIRLGHDAHNFGGEPAVCITRLKFQ